MVCALWRERLRWGVGGSDMMRGATAPQHDVAAGSPGNGQRWLEASLSSLFLFVVIVLEDNG